MNDSEGESESNSESESEGASESGRECVCAQKKRGVLGWLGCVWGVAESGAGRVGLHVDRSDQCVRQPLFSLLLRYCCCTAVVLLLLPQVMRSAASS